jgi:hypothetical protein
VCSGVGEERVYNSCATCISHTISHGTPPAEYPSMPGTRNSSRKGAFASITRDTVHKVWDELDYRIDICRVARGEHIESL